LWGNAGGCGKGTTVAATCVVAREIDAPPDAVPIEWRLLTNRTIDSDTDAVALIDLAIVCSPFFGEEVAVHGVERYQSFANHPLHQALELIERWGPSLLRREHLPGRRFHRRPLRLPVCPGRWFARKRPLTDVLSAVAT
jgi:hypothetical protein